MSYFYLISITTTATDATVANAAHVASGRQPWGDRDAANARHRAGGCKYRLSPPLHAPAMSHKTNELTSFFSLYLGAGQHPATSTNIILDGWTTHPGPDGLFRISSRSHGIEVVFGSQLLTSFCSISLSSLWCRNPTVVHRPLAKKQPYDSWGHTMHVYVQPTQHPDQSQQIHGIFREAFSFPNDDRSISSPGEL